MNKEKQAVPFPVRCLVHIPAGGVTLEADLTLPENPQGIVIFAHGSGSSRKSPRNCYVADVLNEHGLGTLLTDLLTPEEETIDRETKHLRFNISLLAERLEHIIGWARQNPETKELPVACFGASTGAAAALIAAARQSGVVKAVVSRGGRADLAGEYLPQVKAPTLLIVGSHDLEVVILNRQVLQDLNGESALRLVLNATHLFEEPGALKQVAEMASAWFKTHL